MDNYNLLNLIIKFLSLKDIINLSLVNKNLQISLNNKRNHFVNFLWKEQCDNDFYNNETREKIIDVNFISLNNIYFFDWKNLYKKLEENKKKYPDEKIVKTLYEIMKLHSYLPKIRKSIPYIENNFFSKHQIFFLDKKNINLQKINVTQYLNEKVNNEEYKEILIKIFTYQNLKNYKIKKINNPEIQFIIYLYQTIYLYSILNYEYIISINQNEKIFLNEYIERYNDFIDIALILEEKYKNINDSLNLLYNLDNISDFSIYNMIYNIWYNEVYLKLIYNINNSVDLILNNFLSGEFKSKEEISTNITYLNIYDDEIRDNLSLINDIANSILDFSIDKKNVMFINHTHLKVNICYELYEKNILSIIEKFINDEIISSLNWKDNFLKLLNILFSQEEENEFYTEEKNIKIISRTKYFLLNKIINFIIPFIKKELDDKFLSFLNNLENIEIRNNNKGDFLKASKLVINKVKNEINDVKRYLYNIMIEKNYYKNNINNIISYFLFNNGKSIIDFIIQICVIYYNTLEKMENLNQIIVKIISKAFVCQLPKNG